MQPEIEQELARMERMTVGELRDRHAELFGEAFQTRNRRALIRRIAWRLQARAEGSLSERALQRAEELADETTVRRSPPRRAEPPRPGAAIQVPVVTDGRIPRPGMAITRKYKGRTITVTVLADGFEYLGERYRSLTGVAEAVTGTHCNGFRFFRLGGQS